MSKSSPPGCLSLLDSPAEITKKIKRAVTDSDGEVRFDPVTKPGVANLLTIHASLTGGTPAQSAAEFAGGGYGPLKSAVAEVVVAFVEPLQARVAELMADPAELDRMMSHGAVRAAALAAPTLSDAYDRIGFVRGGV